MRGEWGCAAGGVRYCHGRGPSSTAPSASFYPSNHRRFVCWKEKNRLLAVRHAQAAHGDPAAQDPARLRKVRRTMTRIKGVLTERVLEFDDPQQRAALKRVINAAG